jgi:hypothetical protein
MSVLGQGLQRRHQPRQRSPAVEDQAVEAARGEAGRCGQNKICSSSPQHRPRGDTASRSVQPAHVVVAFANERPTMILRHIEMRRSPLVHTFKIKDFDP